jgi:hypothetical protein
VKRIIYGFDRLGKSNARRINDWRLAWRVRGTAVEPVRRHGQPNRV